MCTWWPAAASTACLLSAVGGRLWGGSWAGDKAWHEGWGP